jgi:FAD:protein FMN transferase
VETAASPVLSRTFRSMGTDVSLVADRGSHPRTFLRAARVVERTFAEEDRRFSRFRGDSELARVNARAGRPTPVTPQFAEVVSLALDAAVRTGGLFDPTVLPTLRALGYDRDFDELLAGARDALEPPRSCGRWHEVELDADVVRIPEGVALDLGGIAKGWAADRAAERTVAEGLPWAVVNAGGDIRLAGDAPGGVDVGVEDPEAFGLDLARVRLAHGALATSSITKRAWGPGLHHLIDPRTGAPADGRVLQATAWAPTCADAEVRSKVALLEGGPALDGIPALLVLPDGALVTSFGGMDALEHAEVVA